MSLCFGRGELNLQGYVDSDLGGDVDTQWSATGYVYSFGGTIVSWVSESKVYKTLLTKTRYNNQVLGNYRVDPQRAKLTLIAELTWSNLGLKGVLNKRK